MDMRNWNGTDGLPPLDDDDNNRRFWRDLLAPLRSWPPSMNGMSGKWKLPLGETRKCATPGCAHLAEQEMPFCAVCNLQHLRDAIYAEDPDTLPGWPDRRPAYVELPEPQTPQASDVQASDVQASDVQASDVWPRTYGAPIHSILDDQCRYCRAILIELGEQGEPLPALSASAQFARYMCPRHIQRNVALALTLDRIDDLMRTTPTRRGLSSAEVARTVDASGGGYLMLSDK